MIVKLLTENHLELLSLKGGCTGSSEPTLVKMSHCWKSHVTAHISSPHCTSGNVRNCKMCNELLPWIPYWPNFYLFLKLKSRMRSCHFHNEDDVFHTLSEYHTAQDETFFQEVAANLVHWWAYDIEVHQYRPFWNIMYDWWHLLVDVTIMGTQ